MTKTFIQTREFSKNWELLGFTDDDLRVLENELLNNPKAGKVIRGTGNLRKYRFALPYKGRSGGVLVCYVDFVAFETIYLITVYSKKEKDNLTKTERNQIKKLLDILKDALEQGGHLHE